MGSMEFAVPILNKLHELYGVDLVVTQPDKPVGRKQILQGTPVKNRAVELGIELFQPISIKKDYSKIIENEYDFIIVAAYGQIIPEKVLFHGRYQAINVHASLLPKYRGGSPMHKAIINGDVESGVSVIYMEKALDSGLILSQSKCEISENDNVKTLENKLSFIGSNLLLQTLEDLINDLIVPQKQNLSEVSFAYNFKNEDLRINFSKDAKGVYNFVRGLYPWPVAYFEINDMKIKVFDVEYEDNDLSDVIGQVVRANKNYLSIQTESGIVNLKNLQLQGKKQMDIKDFMNGVGKSLFYEGQILN